MTYKVEFTNRSKPAIYLKEKQLNTNTPITMFGQNYQDYGSIVWSNLLNVLNNWAGSTAPLPAMEGQLWFDLSNNVLKLNTSKELDKPNWVNIEAKAEFSDFGLLKKTGDTLKTDLQLTGPIILDNQIVTKEYVDNTKVTFEQADDRYQYNVLNYCKYFTMNGVIKKSEFVDKKFNVYLPKTMKDVNYSVLSSVATKGSNGEFGVQYYITDKTTTSFVLNIDKDLPDEGEMQLTVVGYTK